MAAYVPVPRDLTRVKNKVLFNLTKRQIICFGAAVIVGVPAFFGIRRLLGTTMAAMCMIFIMLPLFLLAMYEKDGQPMEVIARQFIQAKIIRPAVRPYETDCYYAALMRQAAVYKEVDAIVCEKENGASQKGKAQRAPGGHSGIQGKAPGAAGTPCGTRGTQGKAQKAPYQGTRGKVPKASGNPHSGQE